MEYKKFTLKALRVNEDLTQDEAAEKLGVSRATLVNWEKSKSFPTVEQIKKIENLYNVNYDSIIFLPRKHG